MTLGAAGEARAGEGTLRRAWNAISATAFTVLAAVAIIPFAPLMPQAGLDPGWVFGMNAALERGRACQTARRRDPMFECAP
jgi:hypothetical protein